MTEQDGDVRWIVADPVLDTSGKPEGAVIGNLDVSKLPTILDPELRKGDELVAVDTSQQLIYDTAMGNIDSGPTLLAKGALHTRVNNVAVAPRSQE